MQASNYHIFSLPPELLASLTPRNLVNREPVHPMEPAISTKSGPRACAICQGIVFLDVDEQRSHFRSDWHRFNVKSRLNGGKTVSEENFSELLEGLEDSLSGSASSDDDDDEDSDAVNTLLNKTRPKTNRSPSPSSISTRTPVTALTWFHSPPSTQIGIYRAILSLGSGPDSYLQDLRTMQGGSLKGKTWAMFMVAGGHFAGAIVRISRAEEEENDDEKSRKKKPKRPKPETEVLLHKAFHRYTTRRKQGGSQSANDNAKGPAKSAGALLRRYGQQALREDIRGLLKDWEEEIANCDRIWIRASVSNKKIFYDYDGASFNKKDERLRTFPFPTRRPTQSELARCLAELTHPKISHFTEDELRAQDEEYLASLPKPKPAPMIVQPQPDKEKIKPPKLTKEAEDLREKWGRLLEMVTKGRLEPLKYFLGKESESIGGVNAQIPEWTGEKRATVLQVAVQNGHEHIVYWLLEEAHADPTIPVPACKVDEVEENEARNSDASESALLPLIGARCRSAYDLARTKPVRDVFRRCAATHPDWWDWFGAARVPSALSQEMEEEREEKKKVRRKGLKDRVKEREAREKKKEKDRPVTPPVESKPAVRSVSFANLTSQRLGGSAGSVEGIIGLTPEMRAKVERERRARAAEARLNGIGS